MNWLWRIVDGVWLVALAIFVVSGIDDVPFHGDESTIIFMSRDYHYLVQERDLDAVLYDDHPASEDEQWLRMINGSVSKMAIGLAWDVAGLTVDDVNIQWAWGAGWETNIQQGHMPGERLLRAARWSSALLLVINVWAVFGLTWLLVKRLSGRVTVVRLAAWVASLIYVTTPVVLLNGRRAMFEGAHLCFVTLTLWAAARLVWEQQSPTKTRRGLIIWAVLTGILGGIAVASKHTAAWAVLAVFVALFTEPLIRPTRQSLGDRLRSYRLGRWVRFTVMGLLVVGVFLLLNPAWWSDPLGRPEWVTDTRQDLLRGQTEAFGGYDSVGERVEALLANTFWAAPQYYEAEYWQNYSEIQAQIAAYDGQWIAGRRDGTLAGGVLIAAFLLGVLALVERWRIGPAWLMLIWLAITVAAVLITTPMNWQRYYNPLAPIVAVIAGTGVGWLGNVILMRLRPRSAANMHI